MADPHRIFIGYDPSQDIAYEVLKYSLHKHASEPIEVHPIDADKIPGWNRELDPLQSTPFTYTRFLVPYLCDYEGIGAVHGLRHARARRHHRAVPPADGRPRPAGAQARVQPRGDRRRWAARSRRQYPRKNWSSLMLMNSAELTVWTKEAVETRSGAWLHRFEADRRRPLGDLPEDFNVLDHMTGPTHAAALHVGRPVARGLRGRRPRRPVALVPRGVRALHRGRAVADDKDVEDPVSQPTAAPSPCRTDATPDRSLLAIVPARGGSKGVPYKNFRRSATARSSPTRSRRSSAAGRRRPAGRLERRRERPALGGAPRPRDPRAARRRSRATRRPSPTWPPPRRATSAGAATSASSSRRRRCARRTRSGARAEQLPRGRRGLAGLRACARTHLFWLRRRRTTWRTATPLFAARVNRQFATPRGPARDGLDPARAAPPPCCAGRQMVTAEPPAVRGPAGRVAGHRHRSTTSSPPAGVIERGTVVFRVRANRKIGSGHVHHCLQLADELADQRLRFLLHDCDPFVGELLDEHGYEWRDGDRPRDRPARRWRGPAPATSSSTTCSTRASARSCCSARLGFRVVNIEDLGPGAPAGRLGRQRPLPAGQRRPHEHGRRGPDYATLRGEFLNLPPKVVREARARPDHLRRHGPRQPGAALRAAARRRARLRDQGHLRAPAPPTGTSPTASRSRRHVR